MRGDRTGEFANASDPTIWPTLRGQYCNDADAPAGHGLIRWHDRTDNEAEWTPLALLKVSDA